MIAPYNTSHGLNLNDIISYFQNRRLDQQAQQKWGVDARLVPQVLQQQGQDISQSQFGASHGLDREKFEELVRQFGITSGAQQMRDVLASETQGEQAARNVQQHEERMGAQKAQEERYRQGNLMDFRTYNYQNLSPEQQAWLDEQIGMPRRMTPEEARSAVLGRGGQPQGQPQGPQKQGNPALWNFGKSVLRRLGRIPEAAFEPDVKLSDLTKPSGVPQAPYTPPYLPQQGGQDMGYLQSLMAPSTPPVQQPQMLTAPQQSGGTNFQSGAYTPELPESSGSNLLALLLQLMGGYGPINRERIA